MFRQNLARSIRPALRSQRLSLKPVTAVRTMAEGATGSGTARPGGEASGDAFTKREKAQEDFYIRQAEKKKLQELRVKLQEQRKHLDELDDHIKKLSEESGGEHN